MKLTLFTFLLFTISDLFSQQPVTLYIDKYHLTVEHKEEAAFYMVVTKASKSYSVKEFYLNDTLKETGAYLDMELFTKNGEFVSYHPNGRKESECYFKKGKLQDKATYWYSNGQLKEVLLYDKENHVKIESFYDSLGNALVTKGDGIYTFSDNDEFSRKSVILTGPVVNGLKTGTFTGYLPDGTLFCREEYAGNDLRQGVSYKDGQEFKYNNSSIRDEKSWKKFMMHLKNNMHYPASARRGGVEGTVYLKLIFNDDYTVKRAVVIKGVSPDLDAEAFRVIMETGFKFEPFLKRGQEYPTEMFIVPIRYKLN